MNDFTVNAINIDVFSKIVAFAVKKCMVTTANKRRRTRFECASWLLYRTGIAAAPLGTWSSYRSGPRVIV